MGIRFRLHHCGYFFMVKNPCDSLRSYTVKASILSNKIVLIFPQLRQKNGMERLYLFFVDITIPNIFCNLSKNCCVLTELLFYEICDVNTSLLEFR